MPSRRAVAILDADPTNATDCDTASDQGTFLHAAEFEVFGQDLTG